jgi:hypothetical protein
MASTYLSRTPASAGNQKTFTWSGWIKRAKLTDSQYMFCSLLGNQSRYALIRFTATDEIAIFSGLYTTGSTTTQLMNLQTSAKYRDTSAWYHIVLSVDTTQATSTDRVKLYVNGNLETFDTGTGFHLLPTQNSDTFFNSTYTHRVGSFDGSIEFLNGSMSHVHWIDGTAYDASAFGETDATTGIWKPKTAPSVTYGTNGFFLKFENSGSMGTDSSGNGNNFTVNGTMTQTVDTPSNVFATLNSEYSNVSGLTFSNGNNTITNSGAWKSSISTLGMQKGKWYCEVKLISGTNHSLGVIEYSGSSSDSYYNGANIDNQGLIGGYGKNWGWYVWTGSFRYDANVELTTGNTLGVGDIAQIALDYDNGKIWFGKNGTWENSGDPANGTNPIFSGITFTDATFFAFGPENASDSVNFGNGYFGTTAVSSATSDESGLGIFEHTVPNGYNCLCTKNINTYG